VAGAIRTALVGNGVRHGSRQEKAGQAHTGGADERVLTFQKKRFK
jgi:hypothetical protein